MVIETQVFLNYFLQGEQTPLLVDGISGNLTNTAIRAAIKKLQQKFEKEGMRWDINFNFIGIRTSNTITNRYDDWFIIVTAGTLVAIPSSTKAGTPAIIKYWNRWVKGMRGFGTIKENQTIDYLLVKPAGDAWSNWTGGLGFLYQDKPITVYRDPNTDNKIDTSITITSSGDGFNVHSWKNVNSVFDKKKVLNTFAKELMLGNSVHNMSEGCNVTLADYWAYLFPILSKNAKNVNGQLRIRYNLLKF